MHCIWLKSVCWLPFCGFQAGSVLASYSVLQSAAKCPFLPYFRYCSLYLLCLTIVEKTHGVFSLVEGAEPPRMEILSSTFLFPLWSLFLSFNWYLSLLRNSVLVMSILIHLSLHAAGVERRCSKCAIVFRSLWLIPLIRMLIKCQLGIAV